LDKEILTMEEAAELFGVSIKTFIKLLKEEKVPGRKIGREWRFSRQALINWLAVGDSQIYSASESDTKEFFNEVAPQWEEISRNYSDETLKTKLIELDILKKSMILVDLGAGDGFISRFTAPFVKKVIAVDISGEMLRELRRKAKSGGLRNIETLESDGRDVPLDDSSVDMVCANMYLHHIEQPELALQEMHRIVKPGGTVFLADFYEHSDGELIRKMHDLWPGFNPDQLAASFRKAGFQEVRYETVDQQTTGFPGENGRTPKPTPENTSSKIFFIIAQK
jgi:excisionase family DNA binding protein